MVSRETDPAFYRPQIRRLSELSNEEVRHLFELRASKARDKIDPKGFWDNNKIMYWDGGVMEAFQDLYEVMLEVQSRYPKEHVCSKYGKEGPYFNKLLPLNEMPWINVAIDVHRKRENNEFAENLIK